jgi:hypothetical protein
MMRSAQYLDAVRDALKAYDEDVAGELLASLEEHFEQGLSEGKSEEELCEELGPVSDLISELGTLCEEQSVYRAGDTSGDQGTKKQYEGAGTAYQEYKEVSQEHALVRRERFSGYSVSKIYAELGFADVKLISTTEVTPYVRLQRGSDEPEQYRLEEGIEGDTYIVKLVKNESAPQRKRPFLGQLFSYVSGETDLPIGIHLSLELYVPEGTRALKLVQSSGDVYGEHLELPSLELKSTSGDMNLKKIYAEQMQVVVTSGDVELENINCADLNISSSSGDVDLNHVKTCRMEVQSTSGDVELQDSIADEKMYLHSKSGDFSLEDVKSVRLRAETISGDMTISAQCSEAILQSTSGDVEAAFEQDVHATINTVSGDVSLTLNNEKRGFFAHTQTVSGEVFVDYAGVKGHYGKNTDIRAGMESSRLEINTVSGDINIWE